MKALVLAAALGTLALLGIGCDSDGEDAPDSTVSPSPQMTAGLTASDGTQTPTPATLLTKIPQPSASTPSYTATEVNTKTPSPTPKVPEATVITKPEALSWFHDWSLEGETDLHLAALEGDFDTVQSLLRDGVLVDARAELRVSNQVHPNGSGVYQWLAWEEYSITPLHLGAANGSREVVEALLDAGAAVDALCGDWNALYFAAGYNPDPSVIALLLDRGSNPNPTRLFSETILHQAARYNANPEVIALLIERGVADVNSQSNYGGTPLHQAARYNSTPEVINELISHGADVHDQLIGYTALQWAAKHNPNIQLATALLNGGADVNQYDDKYATVPLALASYNINPAVASILLRRGARVDGNDARSRPLHVAIEKHNLAVIDALLTAGANVHLGDENGVTSCQLAEVYEIPPQDPWMEVYERLCEAGDE